MNAERIELLVNDSHLERLQLEIILNVQEKAKSTHSADVRETKRITVIFPKDAELFEPTLTIFGYTKKGQFE